MAKQLLEAAKRRWARLSGQPTLHHDDYCDRCKMRIFPTDEASVRQSFSTLLLCRPCAKKY